MKHLVFAAILGAMAWVPAVADAQSYRDGSRAHSQDQRHDRGRDHNRSQQRGNSRGHQRDRHRGHSAPSHRGNNRAIVHRAPPRHRAPPQYRQHYRPAPRTVTRVVYTPARPVRHQAHYHQAYYHQPRWQRGQYLPPQYRGSGYYVDHRHHRFAPPPPGHRYVRIDGDAILIGVATGLIAAVLAGAFH